MGAKVANETFVVQFKKAKGVVLFRAGEEHIARMVGESSQVDAVLLAGYDLRSLSFFHIVDLHCLVIACRNQEISHVVKVKGGNTAFGAIRAHRTGELLLAH